jgi:predicted dehydrogenase
VIRTAVVGLGYWGPNLVRAFDATEGAELAAVCDLDRERLNAVSQRYAVATTQQLDEVLSDRGIDAVAIATPAESHFELADRCLRAGKHVYVEKPLTTAAADARRLVATARERRRTLMVGHIFLYDAAVARLAELIDAGAVGAVRYVHGIRTSMSGTARLDTNVVWDSLVHDSYMLPRLLGNAPERVLVTGAGYLSPGIEDVAFATFDFGAGVLAHVYASWYALEKTRRYTVIGSDAILVYDDLAPSRLVRYRRGYAAGDERDPQGRFRWHWRDEGEEPIPVDLGEPLRAECQHFVDCVRQGRAPRSDGRQGLESVRILEACDQSLAQGGVWMTVDMRDGGT